MMTRQNHPTAERLRARAAGYREAADVLSHDGYPATSTVTRAAAESLRRRAEALVCAADLLDERHRLSQRAHFQAV